MLTRDERYIVIFGGTTGSVGGEEEDIYYLDLKTMKWTKAGIKCPGKNDYVAVLSQMNDVYLFGITHRKNNDGFWKIRLKEIIIEYGYDLVFGYLRQNCNEFNTIYQQICSN